ncbi:MAG: hypothetical protein ACYDH5_08775 [Acidimicrobiales bacterium]
MTLWQRALAGHHNVTFRILPHLDHLFVPVQATSTPAGYMAPGHVSPQVVSLVTAWVNGHVPPAPPAR